MSPDDLKITGSSWAMHLSHVPLERVQDVYRSTVIGSAFPPTVKDFGDSWQVIFDDEKREWKSLEWKRHDEQTAKALPASQEGDGRKAWLTLLNRTSRGLGGVLCDCGHAAQLATGSRRWVCQHSKCDFVVNVENIGDLPKVNGGGLSDSITGVAPDVEDELANMAKAASVHSKALSMAAADCNLDLDVMTAQQYSDFRAFMGWWRRDYNTTLSYDIFAEYWPVYTQQRDAQRQAVA